MNQYSSILSGGSGLVTQPFQVRRILTDSSAARSLKLRLRRSQQPTYRCSLLQQLDSPAQPGERALVAEYGNLSWVLSEIEREMEDEEEVGMMRWREKCKEGSTGGGIAELMECLEREAIMGEDEGRDPTDYNRRAQIFDKSSRVFQALKERNNTTTPFDDQHS